MPMASNQGEAQKGELKPGFWKRHGRRIRRTSRGLVIFLLLCFVWSLIEPHLLLVSRVTIQKSDLPPELTGLKIVHLSDLHYGPYVSANMMRKVVEKTNALKPDLVVITGDFIYRDKKYITPLFEILKALKSRDGIYAVFGNHDYWSDLPLLREKMRAAGINELEGRVQALPLRGNHLTIAGMGSLGVSFRKFKEEVAAVPERDFLLLLLHDPDYLKDFRPQQIDLALCGHTHGGQVTLFGLFAFWLPIKSGEKYRSGVVEQGPMTVVISRGIGTIGLPLRFFAPPQIIEITLERKE